MTYVTQHLDLNAFDFIPLNLVFTMARDFMVSDFSFDGKPAGLPRLVLEARVVFDVTSNY
jgi:hypothetical protein